MTKPKEKFTTRLSRKLRNFPIIFLQLLRIWKYRFLSNVQLCINVADIRQPVLMTGQGKIELGKCILGFWPSPYYLNGYIHIDAREATAFVQIEDGVKINNNAVFIAERSSIRIGANTLIGPEFTVTDSDFHDLHPERRLAGTHECRPVNIGRNVFIGSRVMVLKGVTIGDDSVIAAGAVVTVDIPARALAGGVPAKVISYLQIQEYAN